MSFESVYRSKQGAKEINKIAGFIGSLVIKNEYEARIAESTESLSSYYDYYGAYTKTDDFYDYDLDSRRNYYNNVWTWMNSLNRNYSFNKGVLNTLTESRQKALQDQYNKGSQLVIDYLQALRLSRAYQYDERNLYYRQFLGKPKSDEDIVYVINMDVGENGYTKVEDLSVKPEHNLIYYTKNTDGEIKYLGKLVDWKKDNGDGTVSYIADNFYYMNMIPIHTISKAKTPLTYNYFILQQNIKQVIEANPNKYYLKFIGDSYSPYYLRNLPNYAIIKYDNSYLDANELNSFFKAYDKARKQVIMDYINGFDSKQPLYNLLMIQNLLYYTVINYANAYIERYSVGIYTEENCNNILKSHGYDKLTKIGDLALKQRIVRNLNELIENKANNYILELILNKILQDPNSELKRYYLEKKYNVDESYAIKIDTTKGLENSIDLVLREVPVISTKELSSTSDNYHDYDTFIANDKKWGGIESSDSQDTINTKRQILKNKLLSTEFDQILTKYITLTRTVDILDTQRQLRDSIYLMLKYFNEHESPEFFTEKISFDAYDVTPAAIFAAMCWVQQMKYYEEPDVIVKDNCVINSSVVFRKLGTLAVDRNKFENNTFILDGKVVTIYDISPDIASWKVADFIRENPETFKDFLNDVGVDGERIETCRLTDQYDGNDQIKEKGILSYGTIARDGYKHLDNTDTEDITDYLVRFRFYSGGRDLGDFTNATTFEELITDYKTQYPNLIKRITNKLRQSYDYREYQAWMYMLEQSRTDNSINFVFKGYDKFSEYITSMESEGLIEYIRRETNYQSGKNMGKICECLNNLITAFKNWVISSFSTLVYQENDEDTTNTNSTYVNDMILLFDEFLSVFSKLYSVDYNYTFGDPEFDGLTLQLFYNPVFVYMKDKLKDRLNLTYNRESKITTEDSDKIQLDYDYSMSQHNNLVENINNDLEYDTKTKEYIPLDQFQYEQTVHIQDDVKDHIGLIHDLNKIKIKRNLLGNIGLNGILTVKTSWNKEPKTYYETNS